MSYDVGRFKKTRYIDAIDWRRYERIVSFFIYK